MAKRTEKLLFIFFGIVNTAFDGDWSYLDNGALKWENEYPLCNDNDQSPINVKNIVNDDKYCDSPLELYYQSIHHTFRIINTGNVIRVVGISADKNGNNYFDLNENQDTISTLNNVFGNDKDLKYCYYGSEFHFGSEHRIDGKPFSLEIQYIYYSCQYTTINDTINSYDNNGSNNDDLFSIISVLFDIGDENDDLKSLLNDNVINQIQFPSETIIDGFRVFNLMPKNKSFYAYQGSFTHPPCTPSVQWYIMQNTMTLSQEQYNYFSDIYSNLNNSMYNNTRPIQSNSNTVYSCKDIKCIKIVHNISSERFDLLAGIAIGILALGLFIIAIQRWITRKRPKKKKVRGGQTYSNVNATSSDAGYD